MTHDRPILVTMGDPCGVGPEVIARAAARGALGGCVIVGDRAVMARAARQVGLLEPLPVIEPADLPRGSVDLPLGRVHAAAGAAAVSCVTHAAWAALRGEASAIVTAPLSKQGLAAAGLPWPGHTELLQALACTHVGRDMPVRMMLANDELRVVLVTVHQSLRDAIDAVTLRNVLETITVTHATLHRAQDRLCIAVAGLNPHAGEGGLFGREEQTVIAPAVSAARSMGIDIHGPFAPDTVFMRARRGEFDVVVAMTHDHGLIPVKYLGIERGVNVTLGLPFVRTSPDHGTAYDLAGQGVADASSLMAAVGMARRMAAERDAAADPAPPETGRGATGSSFPNRP
jgi:4-hydroxythreonine-4-phosphate dehydrogenase